MTKFRPCSLLEELDIEGSIVENRRGELYRLAAKRIRELELLVHGRGCPNKPEKKNG